MAKFKVIQNPVIDSELRPSTPDLVLGDRTTAVIGGKNTRNSMYMANFLTSEKPSYGGGKLDSFEFLLNCDSISYGGLPQKPRLDLYRLDTAATTEGALTSGSGATTLDTDYLVYSWCPQQEHTNFYDNFAGQSLTPVFFNKTGSVVSTFSQAFITEDDAQLYAQGYNLDEIRTFAKKAIDDKGVFQGFFVEMERGYQDSVSVGGDMSGVLGGQVELNYSHGMYIVEDEGKVPARGRCYLNRSVPEGSPILRTESQVAVAAESQEPIPATTDDTLFFDKFETTRDFIFAAGGANAALTAVNLADEDLTGFASTIEIDSDNALTGSAALKLRTFAREFTDVAQSYTIKDGKGNTHRQYARMEALSLPSPTHMDGEDASSNTPEGPAIGARMEFVINIDKMAPAYQYRGMSSTLCKLQALTAGNIDTNSGGLGVVYIDLDHATYDLANVNANLLSDSLQFLVGKKFEDSDGDSYIVIGYRDNDEILYQRDGHANNPSNNTTLTFRLGADESNGSDLNYGMQITSERGLFFILTDETIPSNLSHASALQNHGKRQNQASNPTSYTVPSMFEFGIIAYPTDTNETKFRVVQQGRLFKHGEPLDGNTADDADDGEAREEFMVDYAGYNFNNENDSVTGFDGIITHGFGGGTASLGGGAAIVNNQPANGNVSGNVRINEGEYFKLILEFNADDDDAKLYLTNMSGESLLGTTNSTIGNYILLKNTNASVTNYKEPTASTTKWPNNLYVYLNNTKDFRTSATHADSAEDDYWLEYASANQKTATDSVVFFDSVKLSNFWPNSLNSTLHANNTMTKGQINMNDGNLPRFDSSSDINAEGKNSVKSFGYLAIGHHTAASVSGNNAYVPLFFDGFSAPLSGLDATTSLTAMTMEAMSASTNEPLGYQLTKASFSTDYDGSGSGNGYASTSFDLTGDFCNEGFIHKGAGVLRWNDAEGGTYPTGTGALTARECLLASTKINKIIDKRSIIVDAPNKLFVDYGKDTDINQRFIIYEYGKAYGTGTRKTGLIIDEINGGKVTFTTDIDLDDGGASSFTSDTDTTNLFVSPIANWVILRYALKESRSFNSLYGVPVHGTDNDTDFTAGVTFNEFLYNDGHNVNNWNLLLVEDSNIITDVDFGFGELKDGAGGMVASKWAAAGVTKFSMNKSAMMKDEKLGDSLPILIQYRTPSDSATNIFTNNNTTNANKPLCATIFEDTLPKVDNFKIEPNQQNPFNIDFSWDCSDDDVWYGFISLSDSNIDSQYTGSIIHLPLNESGDHDTDAGTITDEVGGISVSAGGGTAARKPHYTIAGLAGNALNFDGDDGTNADHLELGGSGNDCLSTVTDEFSVVAHITHDDATVSSNTEYIIKKEGFDMFIDQNEQVNVIFRSDSDSGVTLKSTSKIAAGIPMNVIATLDSKLTSGNCKLFINGKLEALSGLVKASHGDDLVQTGWVIDTDLHSANGKMFIGNESAGGSKAFDGNIEELVFYNTVIYPVDVKSGTFTLDKPLKELSSTSNSSPISYTAKLFVKDYHNIRGGNTSEVACTPALSFRKSGFRLDNS